jgi:hypothetical protein
MKTPDVRVELVRKIRHEYPLCPGPERFRARPLMAAQRLLLRCVGRRSPTALQSVNAISVLLPESFRGGCSFGAALRSAVSPDITWPEPNFSVRCANCSNECSSRTKHIQIHFSGECVMVFMSQVSSSNQAALLQGVDLCRRCPLLLSGSNSLQYGLHCLTCCVELQ